MLNLTRRIGESIVIGHQIEITVVQIERGRVKLGITGPREISVNRKEIELEIQEHGQLKGYETRAS